MVKVAIFGYGTVGSGVYEIIRDNACRVAENAGEKMETKYILDIRDFDDHPEKHLFTKDVNDIINDSEISVVAEVMGGLHPAYEFTKSLLMSGKSVVTSNKELVATYGTELLAIAEEKNVNYLFEASVGGGIPVIRPLSRCLAANNITRIAGILNGTTNYILYQMFTNNKSFETALSDAQAMGYAERNPAADIEGHDACRKIAILTSLAYGKDVDFDDITTIGITDITDKDFAYAKKLGCTIKLFAKSVNKNGKYYAMVAPFVVNSENPLSSVKNVFNAVLVKGNMVADTMYYGKGAGKLATASAVVADVIDCAKHLGKHVNIVWEDEKLEISPIDSASRRFFVRVASTDKDAIEQNFGKVEFLESVSADECGFVTGEMTESEYKAKAAKAGNVINMIRMD